MYARKHLRKLPFRRTLVSVLALVMLLSVCFPAVTAQATGAGDVVAQGGETVVSYEPLIQVEGEFALVPHVFLDGAEVYDVLTVESTESPNEAKITAAQEAAPGEYTVELIAVQDEAELGVYASFPITVIAPQPAVEEPAAEEPVIEEPVVEEPVVDGPSTMSLDPPATEPSAQPTEPSAQPTEPSAEPVEPSAQPVEPSAEPVEPSAEPVEPSAEPTEPSAQPTEPSAEHVEPSAQPTEPSAQPTEPSAEPTEPSADPTEPSAVEETEDGADLAQDQPDGLSLDPEAYTDGTVTIDAEDGYGILTLEGVEVNGDTSCTVTAVYDGGGQIAEGSVEIIPNDDGEGNYALVVFSLEGIYYADVTIDGQDYKIKVMNGVEEASDDGEDQEDKKAGTFERLPNIEIAVGESDTAELNYEPYTRWGYGFDYTVSPDNGGVTVSRDGQIVTVTGNTAGTYTITFDYYYWNGRRIGSVSDNVTVAVTAAQSQTITLTFDPNTANGGAGTAYTMEVTAGEAFTFPDPASIGITPQDGYLFAGWAQQRGTAADPQGKKDFSYRPNVQVNSKDIPTDDQTWYATWIPINGAGQTTAEFYIRLDGVMPYEPSNYAASQYTNGIEIQNALKAPIHVNNDINAVYANLAAQPTEEQIKQVVEAAGMSYEGKKVLWYVIKKEATWHVDGVLLDVDKYQVIYHPNGGSENVPPAVQYAEDETVNVRYDYIPVRNGYTFLGWDEDPNATTPTYTQDGTVNSFTMPAKDVHLYAIWKPNDSTLYYIDYYLVEPDGTVTQQTAETVTKYGTTGETATVQDSDIKTFPNYSYDSTHEGTVLSGTIDADDPLHLKLYYVRSTATLTVEKVFVGITADQYPEVQVTVAGVGNDTNQTLTLNSTNNYQETLSGLYAGYTYTVTEATAGGIQIENYDLTTTYSPANGQITLTADGENKVTVTNTYTANTVDLTIEKLVTGSMGDTTKSFSFSWSYGTEAGQSGTFELTHGEYTTISGIPVGADLIITETNADGYVVTGTYNNVNQTATDGKMSFTIVEGADKITVTNDKDVVPDTGVALDSLPYVLLLATVCLGGALLLRKGRRAWSGADRM